MNPLEHLRWLRDEFSNEQPEEIITSASHGVLDGQPPRLKTRKGWFAGVVADLENAVCDGQIAEGMIDEVNAFIGDYTGRLFDPEKPREKVLKDDIERADSLITKILDEKKNDRHHRT